MTPLIGGLLDAGLKVLDRVLPDPAQKAAAQLELLKLQQTGEFKVLEADLPLRVVDPGTRDDLPTPLVTVHGDGVEVSAVKVADDGSGDVIVRLYEACGDRAATTVRLPWRITNARVCNLLEEADHALETSDGIVALTLRPFELVTLRLR